MSSEKQTKKRQSKNPEGTQGAQHIKIASWARVLFCGNSVVQCHMNDTT